MNFSKFMVHEFFGINSPRFFGIHGPTIFCDFGLLSRLAQAEGGGGLLYDISLQKRDCLSLLKYIKMDAKTGKNKGKTGKLQGKTPEGE